MAMSGRSGALGLLVALASGGCGAPSEDEIWIEFH
jgi:hypothetical protein